MWNLLSRSCWGALILALIAGSDVHAAASTYQLAFPAGRSATFEVPIALAHAGRLTIEAHWSGNRPLAWRLSIPHGATLRRSGPSPIRFETEIAPDVAGPSASCRLIVHALPAREDSAAVVVVELSDTALVEPEPDREPERAPARPPEPWALPQPAPEGLVPEWLRLHAATERLRALAVEQTDSCQWQSELLRFVAGVREQREMAEMLTDPATRRALRALARAVHDVDALRLADDPLIAGPVPAEPSNRRVWHVLRNERMAPLEHALDDLSLLLFGTDASALGAEPWARRFLSCLLTCERYFEGRGRLGEDRAPHGVLAREQWDRVLAAADVFESLAELP